MLLQPALALLTSVVSTSSVADTATDPAAADARHRVVVTSSIAGPYVDPAAADAHRRDLLARARELDLHTQRGWQVLLHYEPQLFGQWESEVDSEHFFLAEGGKENPQAELQATIEAFFAPSVEETAEVQHPQCQFPARFSWLDEQLGFDDRMARQPCPRFEAWHKRLAPHSVSIIFAAAYINNPASMFGHTLLRINREKRGVGADLVSYTVNFAANPTTNNAFLYSMMGVFGGFPGTFSTMPYYMKVKEYGDIENRDLWEYDLDLTDAEIDRMVRHLWEMGHVYFDYFYLDENCSYQLLWIVQAARPSLHMVETFNTWVNPVDTVRAMIDQPGLVSKRTFRPSRATKMGAMRGALTSDEWSIAKGLADDGGPDDFAALGQLETPRQAAVLDTAYEHLKYRTAGDDEVPEADQALERKLLLTRGKLGVSSTPPEVVPGPPPDVSHPTTMLSIGGGHAAYGPFLDVKLRPGLHDLLADQRGLIVNSQIELMPITFRVPLEDNELPILDRLDLVRIVSITGVSSWSFRPSWRVSLGLDRLDDGGCVTDCLHFQISGGPGLAVDVDLGVDVTLYGFVDAHGGLGGVFRDWYRVGLGASSGVIVNFGPFGRFHGEASYLYPFAGVERPGFVPGPDDGPEFRLTAAQSIFLSKDFELRGRITRGRAYTEGLGSLLMYF